MTGLMLFWWQAHSSKKPPSPPEGRAVRMGRETTRNTVQTTDTAVGPDGPDDDPSLTSMGDQAYDAGTQQPAAASTQAHVPLAGDPAQLWNTLPPVDRRSWLLKTVLWKDKQGLKQATSARGTPLCCLCPGRPRDGSARPSSAPRPSSTFTTGDASGRSTRKSCCFGSILQMIQYSKPWGVISSVSEP